MTPGPGDKLKALWRETRSDRIRIAAYLESRDLPAGTLDRVSEDALRFHPNLGYWGQNEVGTLVHLGDFPAMVAKVTNAAGKGVNLHRTYLAIDGPGKAPIEPAKKLMSATADGATTGAAIRLLPATSVLGFAEGIETALAIHAATGQAVWSTVSAGGLAKVIAPEEARTVHIWADNDTSGVGQKAAARAAARFHAEGRTVFVHVPPEAGTDWLDVYRGQGPDVLLDQLAAGAPWMSAATDVGIILSEVEPERVTWLWSGRIPLGKLTVMDGDPGQGKSTIALDLAARVTRGWTMPDGDGGCAPAGVVILSGEDGLADTIVPRLMVAGADLDRVVALNSCPNREGEGEHPPVLPDDLPFIRAAIARVKAQLVVIDPLMAYLSGDTNSHKDQDIRRVLFQVATLAEETGAAVLVVRHLNKTSGSPAIYRGGGSIGIIGAARSGLLVASDPDDDTHKVLACTKSNLSSPPESLGFHLEATEGGAARVVWDGTSAYTASALLAVPDTDEERHAIDDAKDFLVTALCEGPVAGSQIIAEARGAGISERTLKRAKAALGVTSRKGSMTGPWVWSLPEGCQRIPKSAIPTGWHPSGNVGTLRESRTVADASETDQVAPVEVLI